MWEAFLVHMNDFDRLLETKLRTLLDPVVAVPAPPRRERLTKSRRPVLRVESGSGRAVVETIPVVVTGSRPSLRLLP